MSAYTNSLLRQIAELSQEMVEVLNSRGLMPPPEMRELSPPLSLLEQFHAAPPEHQEEVRAHVISQIPPSPPTRTQRVILYVRSLARSVGY